jgi:hypothetical protein
MLASITARTFPFLTRLVQQRHDVYIYWHPAPFLENPFRHLMSRVNPLESGLYRPLPLTQGILQEVPTDLGNTPFLPPCDLLEPPVLFRPQQNLGPI